MKFSTRYFILFILIKIVFFTHFLLFVIQRSLIFITKNPSNLPVYETYEMMDIFYKDNKSDTDLIYCHGSIISGKVYKKLLLEMGNKTNLNVLSFYIKGMFNKRGIPSEKGIRLEIDNLIKYLSSRNKKYIIFGQSLGCCLAIQISRSLKIEKCILENPFINYKSVISTSLLWKYFTWLIVDIWDNHRIKELKNVLFLLSNKDDLVSNSNGEEMSKKVKNGYIEILEGSNHYNSALNVNYYKYINKFIQR